MTRASGAAAGLAAALLLAGCALLSLALLVPFRALQVHQFVDRHLAQEPKASSGTARLVFVDPRAGYYAWDLVQNDPFLRAPVLRLLSHGDAADAAFADRHAPDAVRLAKTPQGSVWGRP